jgi:hypothetical protein
MNPPETNDPLDKMLREQNSHIDDAGFTARVVSALPRRHLRFRLRPILLLAAAAIGSVLATLWLPRAGLPVLSAPALFSLDFQVLGPWAILLLVAASLTWAVIAAMRPED